MAKVPAHPSRVYADEFDISGYINSTSLALKQETAVVTTFVDTGPRRVVGNYDHQHDHMGFFDGVALAYDERVYVDLQTDEDHFLSQCFGSAAAGDVAYDSVFRLAEQMRKGGVGEAVLLSIKSDGSNGVARGLILTTGAFTIDNTGTGRNMGVTTAGQTFAATLRVLAYSGLTSVLLKIQESSDNAGADAYADITGLTDTFTAIGASRKTTILATEAWKRAIVDVTGTGSATVLVTAGLVKGT